MQFGKLTFEPVGQHPRLVAAATLKLIQELDLSAVMVSEIDESLADTAAFCEQYAVGLDVSANCVIVAAKRAEKSWYAACVILATTKADVNNAVRRTLDARKISFASMDDATAHTGMMYGGITPIGLPTSWPLLIDSRVAATDRVVIGSGIRGSKLLVPGSLLAELPSATVLDIAKS